MHWFVFYEQIYAVSFFMVHGVHTNLYSTKNREKESEVLAQDD